MYVSVAPCHLHRYLNEQMYRYNNGKDTNVEVPEGVMLVVLRSYFDAGNQADSREYDVLSLAVASGTLNEWGPFENEWGDMLTCIIRESA
jgi:hypothetical protein